MPARKRTFVQAGCLGRNWPSVACPPPKRRPHQAAGLVLEALRDGRCPFRVESRDGALSRRILIVREDVRTFAGLSFSLPTDPMFTPAAATSKPDAIKTLNLPVMQCSAYFKANPAPGNRPPSSSLSPTYWVSLGSTFRPASSECTGA